MKKVAPKQTPEQAAKELLEAKKIECEKKAEELSKVHSCKVYPMIFRVGIDGDIVVGYIKEPSRQVKLAVMDKSLTYPVSAVAEILPLIIIAEESDPRILSDAPENDAYNLGAVNMVSSIIQTAVNQFKKK